MNSMGIVITLFTFLFIAFLIGSGLIVRHTLKFGYLNPKFRLVTVIYIVLSLLVILLGIYLLTQAGAAPSPAPYTPGSSNSSTELNF